MLTRWYQTPSSVVEWQRPLFRSSLFDDVFENFFAQARSVSAGPRLTSYDHGGEVVLRAEVPGMSEKDIQISCENDVVTILGERRIEVPEGYQPRIRERSAMRFSRSFTVPPECDLEKAEARIENGLLTMTIPKRPEVQPRQIPIKAS
jgi:HSP20 family protein